eukprot:4599829-Prymnesium_polylepis.1
MVATRKIPPTECTKWPGAAPSPVSPQCSARTPTRPDGATIRSIDPDTRHDDHSIDTLAHDNNIQAQQALSTLSH